MKDKIFVSFSGGRTSAFMSRWILDNWGHKDLCFVFANTGKEDVRTLDFVNECDKRWGLNVVWIEYNPQDEHGKKNWFNVVNYRTASRNGEPFERFIKKERLPNAAYPNCSGRLKSLPMHNFIKSIGWKDYKTAIGIRADEVQRVNWESANKNGLVYPLITDFRVSKEYVRHWWDSQPFDLNIKDYEGNCDMCWKKSDRKLLTLIKENPDKIKWWNEMEMKYGEGEYSFFRGNQTAQDLVERSKTENFRLSQDEHEVDKLQTSMFDPLDLGTSCFCGDT